MVANLKYCDVRLLDIAAENVMHEEIVRNDCGRVRETVCGPAGSVCVVMNEPDVILRVPMQSKRINP